MNTSSPHVHNLGEIRLSSPTRGTANGTTLADVSAGFSNLPNLKLSASSVPSSQSICTIKTPLGKPTSTFVSKVIIAPKRQTPTNTSESLSAQGEISKKGSPPRDILPTYIPPQPYRGLGVDRSPRGNSPEWGTTTKAVSRPMSPKNMSDSKIPVRISDPGNISS